MNATGRFRRAAKPEKKLVISTTFFDLVERLSEMAQDDAALVASVRRVLEGCNVRLAHSMAPLRVAAQTAEPARLRQRRANRLVWA